MKTTLVSVLTICSLLIFAGSAIAEDINPKVVFETSKGKIVWKYISPVTKGGDIIAMETDPLETNTVFRCTRILPDYAGLKNRDLTPMGTFHEVYPDKIITKVVANKGGKKGGKKGRNKGGKK